LNREPVTESSTVRLRDVQWLEWAEEARLVNKKAEYRVVEILVAQHARVLEFLKPRVASREPVLTLDEAGPVTVMPAGLARLHGRERRRP
jgi:hypothetical protein